MKVGVVGFGFMGRMHYRCWKALGDVEIVAVCDADPKAIADRARGRGNIAGADGEVDLGGIAIHADPLAMFARENLDAVSIAAPTHLHAPLTIAALEAGIHVLCEKPMALRSTDGARMIEAAERSGKLLQIGHCIRFWPEYAKAREIVESGAFGRVIAASFARFAATAHRKEGDWFIDERRSGGMALDLHIHDTDYIQHLFGMPRAVCSHGARTPAGGLAHIVSRYCYGDDKLVTAECGWAMTPSFGFEMRFLIAMEEATIAFDHARRPTLKLCPAGGEPIVPPLQAGDGYALQIAHFAARVRGEFLPPVTTPGQALNSMRIVEAECLSARSGNTIQIA